MSPSSSPSPLRQMARFAFWIIAPLLAGTLLAFAVVPVPKIGVIRFEDTIWYYSAEQLNTLIEHVRTDPTIRAVVLEIDSPGGSVNPTEEIYYRLLQLRESKPLIIAIDSMAASGGYYIAVAGDHIFAKPSSTIGNVGVISLLPSTADQRFTDEDYVSTGPFKFSGGTRGDYMRQIELVKQGFLEAVFAQRDLELRIDRQALSSGEVFLGMQALDKGLIDELGARSEAVQKAAQMAHLAQYDIVDVNKLLFGEEQEEWFFGASDEDASAQTPDMEPGLYYLYIEPEKRRQ